MGHDLEARPTVRDALAAGDLHVEWAALKKMLAAIAAPKHQAAVQGAGAPRPDTPEALGQAFCELIERCPAERLPNTGGVSATMVVLIDLDVLLGKLEKACVLDTGGATTERGGQTRLVLGLLAPPQVPVRAHEAQTVRASGPPACVVTPARARSPLARARAPRSARSPGRDRQ